MQIVPGLTTAFPCDRSLFNLAHTPATRHPSDAPRVCTDEQFVAMLNAYRGSGGLVRDGELLALFRRSSGPDADTLANWIAQREVIGFEWQSRTWFPVFQFRHLDMERQPALGQVFAELIPAYDSWDLADWFAQPNPWLADRVPAETLELDSFAVLQAARVGRFIVNS